MKKKREEIVIVDKKVVKTIDLLRVIQEVWCDFHNTDDNDKKMDCIMDVLYGFFVYTLLRYDYHNYRRLFIDKEEKEEIENE